MKKKKAKRKKNKKPNFVKSRIYNYLFLTHDFGRVTYDLKQEKIPF